MANEKTEIEKIIDTFASSIDINQNYNNKELQYYLKMACKTHKKHNKKPREPTEYNMFVRHQMTELKLSNPTLDARDRFKEIGKLWNQYKLNKLTN